LIYSTLLQLYTFSICPSPNSEQMAKINSLYSCQNSGLESGCFIRGYNIHMTFKNYMT
jgi:hypothetical protein